jgi:hypothetical protein
MTYIKDPKSSTRKLLVLRNTFNEVTGYKNQHTKMNGFSIVKTIPFTTPSKNKIPRVKPNQGDERPLQ